MTKETIESKSKVRKRHIHFVGRTLTDTHINNVHCVRAIMYVFFFVNVSVLSNHSTPSILWLLRMRFFSMDRFTHFWIKATQFTTQLNVQTIIQRNQTMR